MTQLEMKNLIAKLEALTAELKKTLEPKKRYFKLKYELPTFRVGDTFTIEDDGCLYLDGDATEHGHLKKRIMAYHKKTLEAFPNILEDWFEEIEKPTETEEE